MKKLLFLGLLLPVMMWSQNDFETRYFTIDAASLPEIPEVTFIPKTETIENSESKGTLTLSHTPSFNTVLDSYQISATNYWQPVDMAVALGGSTVEFTDPSIRLKKLQEKQFGFTVTGNGGESTFDFSDGESRVRNSSYQQQRPIFVPQAGDVRVYRNPFFHQRGTPFRN